MSGTLLWVGGGEWGCMEHYFGLVGAGGALFWVGRGGWANMLGRWG